MTLESQVCSLEFAKRLKELGVKQESYFYWNVPNPSQEEEMAYPEEELNPRIFTKKEWDEYAEDYTPPEGKMFPAPTAGELGEMLPPNEITYSKDGDKWCALLGSNIQEGHAEFADTLVDAMALMRIHLEEKSLL